MLLTVILHAVISTFLYKRLFKRTTAQDKDRIWIFFDYHKLEAISAIFQEYKCCLNHKQQKRFFLSKTQLFS